MSLMSTISKDSSGYQELYATAEVSVANISDTVARVTISAQAFMKNSYLYGVRCWTTINNSSRAYGGGGYLGSGYSYAKDIPGTWTEQTMDFPRGQSDYSVPVQFGFEGVLVSGIGAWPWGSGERIPYYVTIPAAPYAVSDFTIPASLDIGQSLPVTISRTGSVTHSLSVAFGSSTASGSGYTDSASLAIPMDFCGEIPNSTSGVATVTLSTYYGAELIGSKSKSLILTVPASVKPTAGTIGFAPKHDIYSPAVPSAWGVYVKGRSGVTATASGGSGSYDSTIVSRTIIGAGLSGASPLTTGALQQSTQFTARFTDSRGRYSDVTGTVSVADYAPPSYTSVAAGRVNSSGTADLNGTYGGVTASVAFTRYLGGAAGDNAITTKLEYKDSTSSTWIEVPGGFTSGVQKVFSGLDTSKTYDIRLTVQDYFGEPQVYTTTINPSVPIMHVSASGGVGIQQRAVDGKALAVGGDVEVKGESLFLAVHPIGSLFLSMDSTNPGTLFGGTWALVSAGRMLVGVDAADTDFNAAGKTGGSKYLQAHTHSHNHKHGLSEAFAGITAGANSIAVALKTGVSWARSRTITGTLTSTESTASVSDAAQLFGSTDGVTDAAGTQQTGSAGTGGAENLPPYYACYIWRRTA